MKFLTIPEYAKLKQISRQAVHQRIKRGTLKLVKIEMEVERIPVDETDFIAVNA